MQAGEGEGASPREGETEGYHGKPPLWQAPPAPPASTWSRVLTWLVGLGAVGVVAVLLEYWFFSVPVGEVEVTVVAVQAAVPADEGRPPVYQYRVRLPEGQQMMVTYPELLKAGTRLVATKTQSRLTGWTRLTGPYHLVESDAGPGTR